MKQKIALMLWCGLALGLLFHGRTMAADLPDFTALVEANAASVVNVSTTRRVNTEDRQLFGPEGSWRRFPRQLPVPESRPSSLGSGFIVSEDGYILTSNHVIGDADEVLVRFSDRRELPAELIGADLRSDLALLKVDATELQAVRLGRSDELQVGEWVLAIGSPFGFYNSVTVGVVSAKGRILPSERNEHYVPFIQTDVAINRGNSGGPLFNLKGEVVGINSQIYSRSGGYIGLSFAIPINVAMEVVEQLKSNGRVSRGWLGVVIQEVGRDLAESFGLDRPHGALINDVTPGAPADEGGLRAGDIIIEFNGHAIDRSVDLPHQVGRTPAGTDAKLKIVRGGKQISLQMKVGELPDTDDMDMDMARRGGGDPSQLGLGLGLEDLPEAVLSRLNIVGGVRVVQSSGPAVESGVHVGDVIAQLNHLPIKNVEEFVRIAESLPKGHRVPILVLRGHQQLYVPLLVPE